MINKFINLNNGRGTQIFLLITLNRYFLSLQAVCFSQFFTFHSFFSDIAGLSGTSGPATDAVVGLLKSPEVSLCVTDRAVVWFPLLHETEVKEKHVQHFFLSK